MSGDRYREDPPEEEVPHEHAESDPEAGQFGHGVNTDEEMMLSRVEDDS